MAHLQLPSHVSYGLVGDSAIFLDLRRDRYLALDAKAEKAFRRIRATGEPLTPDPADRERLLATGLFREGSFRGRLAPASAPTPAQSLLDESFGRRFSLTSVLRAWTAVVRARRQLERLTLFEIVEAIRERRYASRVESRRGGTEEAARGFHAARSLVPIERHCLLDSLALFEWLGEEPDEAKLVFGVRTNPFGAHCWVQTDRLLLTDASDTIGPFVPVLSV